MLRQIQLWAATLCALVLLAACADAPTAPQRPVGEQRASTSPAFDNQTTQGCVIEGFCYLPPISGGR